MNDPDPFVFFEEASPTAIEVPVLKVFDGDGFLTRIPYCHLTNNPKHHAEVEVTVRCGFIDAPELEQKGGHEAREFLTALIGGRTVWIEILMKMDTGKSVDRYGRVVAVPYLVDRYSVPMFTNRFVHLARNIELAMLLNGWAWVLERYEPDEIYFEALDVAQRNRRGIWAYADNVHPWTFKRQKYNSRRALAREPKQCPAEGCVGSLVKRNGKFGAFYGCSSYPNCRYSRSI
jgi:endonuclease YncB( thermonuclease family)